MAQPRLTRAAPSFAVVDVFETAEYYRDVLGFRFDQIWGNPPSFVMLDRDDVVVMMKQVKAEALPTPAAERSGEQVDMYFWATNVRALAEELKAKGADIVEGPVDRQIYNGRELIVRDPNGLIICFGQLLDENPD
jgi:catechol 2,3-dioxygenase-like lactoylglutathione lyase family enzyme